MAEEVVALEVVGGEDAVPGLLQGNQLLKLLAQLLAEEAQGRLLRQLIGLEEVEEVALLLQELQVLVEPCQLLEGGRGEKVGEGVVDEGVGLPLHVD